MGSNGALRRSARKCPLPGRRHSRKHAMESQRQRAATTQRGGVAARCSIHVSPRIALGWLAIASASLWLGSSQCLAAPPHKNGFDLAQTSIAPEEILHGGPPRDGIPALDTPATVAAASAPWSDDSWVVGVEVAGEARAYPISILVWHELVNDRLGGRDILVSYCPLCGSALVFDRLVSSGAEPNRATENSSPALPPAPALAFGVSGLLYRSDMLMFDRDSESLWLQITGRAVSGPRIGQRLDLYPSRLLTWSEWRALHPTTSVLSRETGHRRDYGRSPYGDYSTSERLFFPIPRLLRDDRYPIKTRTLGMRMPDGRARAYTEPELRASGNRIEEVWEGMRVRVRRESGSGALSAEVPPGVEVLQMYWFAWMALHPESTVFRANH